MQVRLRSEGEIIYTKEAHTNDNNETVITRFPRSKKFNVKVRRVYKIKVKLLDGLW